MELESIKHAIKQLETDISHQQWAQLEQFAKFLHEKNQVMNLTAIDDVTGIYEKHFYDSLLMLNTLKPFETMCDLGSGAGFPGVVVALMRPKGLITLVEPLKKRCNFLKELTDLLGLENVKILNRRAEELHELRESFDVVTARAVARLNVLAELGLPLVRVGGYLVAMKASQALEEAEEAKKAIKECGGKLIKPTTQYLPDGSLRYNLTIEKIRKTPSHYPRRYSQIKRKPL